MITAIFNDKMDNTVAYGLWQWDYGQVLRIKGIDFSQFAIEIHFSFNEDDEDSTIAVGVTKEIEYESTIINDGETIVTSETIQVLDVTIPKDFLWNRNKKNYTIYVFLHLSNEEIGHTVKKILLPVKIKARPTYPHASEDEALFHSTLEQINEYAQTAIDNAKLSKSYAVGGTETRDGEDVDNAKYYAEQASTSSEEATLQAENAKQSANNAKEYEENAELSANKAKEYETSSKTNTDNAKEYKDWAYEYKNNAQEYSIASREYRDEAESAKNIALQASIDTGKVRDEVNRTKTQIDGIADTIDNQLSNVTELANQVQTDKEIVANNTVITNTNVETTNNNVELTNQNKTATDEALANSRRINEEVLTIKNEVMGFAENASRIVAENIATHNISSTAHDDIRQLIIGLNNKLNTVLDSDDSTLDQLSEIVNYIKDNRDLIETITTSKINVSDIIDNLTTTSSNKPLSAKQGKVLKDLIDAIVIPTKVSAFVNDKGYLTEHQNLSDYVKNTDYATTDKGGVVKVNTLRGIGITNKGELLPVFASLDQIKAGQESFRVLVPASQHDATFYGLAKAAGDTTQSASNNEVGVYTDDAKTKIKSMIGVPTKTSDLINDSGYLTTETQSNWTETDSTSASYIQNKPSIAKGTGVGSIIEGSITGNTANIASKIYSHAEGAQTISSGNISHAEGLMTESSGVVSHAEGYKTIAGSAYQHVQGKFNVEDANSTYAHIVGNGADEDNRSNAHTLDWNGNAWFAGKITVEGTPTTDNDVVTKGFIDTSYGIYVTDDNNGTVTLHFGISS